jgi:hypothetical protein
MWKLKSIALVTTLGLSLAIAPTAQAKAKVTKPSAPTISAVSSSAAKKGKVNVTVTITLSASDGGSKITGSKVSAGGKSCTIAKTKTSCTIKSIKNGKALNLTAKSKNKKGFSSASTSVAYTAGAGSWPTTPVATVVSETPAAAAPAPVASPAPLTCATGGTCEVGDRGPGGGNIFYVATGTFSCGANLTSTCKYLEAAPSYWSTSPQRPWATGTPTSGNAISDVTGITNEDGENNTSTGIGLGLKNSIAIVAQNGTYDAIYNDYAAGAARAYAGNSKSDWYLPTTAELNQMCKWARAVAWTSDETVCTGGTLNLGTGAGLGAEGFAESVYWSSSEGGYTSELDGELDAGAAWGQFFYRAGLLNNCYQDTRFKDENLYVRPVRAF